MRYARHVAWIVGLSLLAGCGGGISPPAMFLLLQEASDLIEERAGDPDFAILDVRTAEEYAAGHLEGAILLDFTDPGFEQRLALLDRDVLYLVYCGSGFRSAGACEKMTALGFRNISEMGEGFNAWVAEGYPWTVD